MRCAFAAVVLTGFIGACGGTSDRETTSITPPDGPLLLQAFGGPTGQVAAQVPLFEPGVGQQETCGSPVTAGACQLTACQVSGGIGSPGPGYGDFGPITATVSTTTVPLPYNQDGYPTVYFPSSVTLGTGGTMTFRGGGNGVPKFDIAATIPGVGVITSPVPTTSGGATTIDTSQDLPVTWQPITIGQIDFDLEANGTGAGGTSVTVTCTFDGASGAGVVSQALLSSLKQMSGANAIYGSLSSELDASTVVDGLEIETQSYQRSTSTNADFKVALK